jgi:hypothetical protein
MKRHLLNAAAVAAILVAGAARADTLSINSLLVDNGFNAYLSTSDSTLGTLFDSGNNWRLAYAASTALTPGQNYYLHIVASNWGSSDGVDGSFGITGSNFVFENGTTTLTTATASDFKANDALSSSTAVYNGQTYAHYDPTGANWFAPTATAKIGSPPNWGAPWLWSATNQAYDLVASTYISTEIVYDGTDSGGVSPTPELSTSLMLTVGMLAFGFAAYRRQKAFG